MEAASGSKAKMSLSLKIPALNGQKIKKYFDLKLYLDLDETAEQSVYLKKYFEVEKRVGFRANIILSFKLPDLK